MTTVRQILSGGHYRHRQMTSRGRRHRQQGQALVEYALALVTVAFAFIAGAQAMSGIWEAQLSAMAGAMSSESIKSSF
jgi:Flp pilus assembly pilin Flp